ncbi:SEN1 N terminal-domain-containing protein [Dactylonectria macrodidyma]|uniref:SEN1 N terminal-domain-containing protein n=1 Tax=Dactylonectria macrodidyma TaxID=307937 RepID=A0A9P9FV13_9HYPO|nr:SEN1 N terminal-domain-containing protein [Dactylonectria macrodidyma]
MSDIMNDELAPWFEEFQKFPEGCHLLCPRISEDDEENYKILDDPDSKISLEEKKQRIERGKERIEVTYWNTLIFGFDKKLGGKWLEEFTKKFEDGLKVCAECVLNWHMKRKATLLKFSERWNEEAVADIQDMFEKLDVRRIDHNLQWAKDYIEKIESTGTVFKKSLFGDHIAAVHITVYEALCCIPYMANPDQRATFQYVFRRLQGKSVLKLGTKDPLPGMTYFLFDQKNEDRRKWAMENWKNLDTSAMTQEQFDWALSGGLVGAMDDVNRKDITQPTTEIYLEIERFWLGFEEILRTLNADIITHQLRGLEMRAGCPNIYDLLFRHIQFCHSEGVLVATIRILTGFLKKAPKAFWDVIGDARPNVIADLLFGSPVYKDLLRQSLEDCWTGFDTGTSLVPFPTSWVDPWLQSLGRDRRYDACEVLMHTLFESLAKDASIGEPGQAACIRAGFDALHFTMSTFLDSETKIGVGTTHLYASGAFNLVMKYKDLILRNLRPPTGNREGWQTFQVAIAAKRVLQTAMKLDMKVFAEEFDSLLEGKQLQSTIVRNSKIFWEGVVEMFDVSSEQVDLARDILLSLEPLIGIEQIRPLKSGQLTESGKRFNAALEGTINVLGSTLGRISELDATDLNTLFDDRLAFQDTIGLSVHGESDLAEAASELLKSWTGELSRSGAFEQMSQLHPDQTLSSIVWSLEHILRPPNPWGPIRPILNMSRDVLRGLVDPLSGVLRVKTLEPISAAKVLRWWTEQWRFVSTACKNIENWSRYIQNSIMQEFCREIMELAEALVAEDGLIAAAISKSLNKSEKEAMTQILIPAKQHFGGMENMIRLKDKWLVDVTVRVLCKILTRLRENGHEIHAASRKLITDACLPTVVPGKYVRSTNLTDQQRAELLQALGQTDDEVQIYQLGIASQAADLAAQKTKDKVKKQSRLDAWSKSGTSATTSSAKAARSNRDDVLDMSKSIDNPILKQIEARKAKAKAKAKLPDQKAISALKESRQREKLEKAKRDAEAIARAKQLRGEIVPGEGSGLLGLGLSGKDHRSDIMVNSSDEESEDEDDDDSDTDNELAALSTGGLKTLDEAERRRRAALNDKVRKPVKKVRQQRSVKEMRARLIPPMDRLHNTILAWDIFHEGNDPPAGPTASEVATKYLNPTTYQETFFPLLASEAWRSFVTSKDEVTSQPFGMKIASRASVDSYLEVTFTMPVAQSNDKDRRIMEGDILLVSEAESPLNDKTARHCLARVHRTTYKKTLIEITYRVASRGNPLSQVLTPGASVHGIKITNMTTIEREYAALESLQYYDLMDEILKAEPSPVLRYGEEKVSNYMENFSLNRGQALAVLGAHDNDGFTLIQGPPGTGKTKTIVAMVGTLLSEQLSQMGTTGTPVGVPVRPTGVAASNNQPRPKKLLVCAPSNAAVDELVLRLKSGIKTIGGKTRNIGVIRLGRSDAINAAVRDVTLDELVKARLEGDTTKEKAKADREKLHEDAAKIKEELALLRPRLEETRGLDDRALYNTLSRQFEMLKRRQMQIGKEIDAQKDSGNSVAREMEMRRRQVQQEILNSAQVLCATLSGSGHEMFRNLDVEFETVIIDEAAQCVELSALIPLKYGCCKCILVGDPKQLPPTVLSQSAARFGYDQSLFVRMQQNHPKSVHLLDMQYRMHPEISMFPSREFYEGQLQDGQNMQELRQQPWHKNLLLGPYRFFDVQGVQERGNRGRSLVNTKELDVAMQIYDRFSKEHGDSDLTGKIGIITPYKAQLFELRNRFTSRYGEGITNIIEFNTTDAFQGRECEIIIFSCVRASPTGGIGFMTDIRRMNVGLTRAKSSLWILGDSRALVQGEFWRKLIQDAQARDRYTQGDILSMLRKPLVQAKQGTYTLPAPAPQAQVRELTMRDAPAAPAQTREVAMRDAPAINTARSQPVSHPVSPTAASGNPPRALGPAQIPGLGGLGKSEVMPRSGGPPVIHTSTSKPPGSEGKKRTLDGVDSNQPVPKRVASDKARGGGLMGKFGQRPNRASNKLPTDPSAMSVLGMVPPERPPAIPTGPANSTTTSSGSASNQRNETGNSKPPQKSLPPPNPRKKGKPSLFVPKRR